MLDTGIYRIRNTVNGKIYVGSAVSFRKRWGLHRRQLNAGCHHSRVLGRAWDKYGSDAFVFERILVCGRGMLLEYEQRAIDVLKPEYNCSPTAGSTLGAKYPPEACANVSAGQKGKKFSEEHRAKLAAAGTGRYYSPETREKISKSKKGKKQTPEAVEANRRAHLGIRVSEEAKAKLSAYNKGRTHSAETREKLSRAAKLRTPPVQSPETRAKRSASHLAYQAKKRAAAKQEAMQ